MFFRKPSYRFLQFLLQFVAVEIGVGFEFVKQEKVFAALACVRAFAFAVQEIDAFVYGNLEQPCRKLRVSPEIPYVAPCFDESILQ